jgi:hypothetical protein
VLLAIGPTLGAAAVTHGLAGRLFFSIGDVSTKVATQGGTRLVFVVALITGYTVGTALLQIGYQAGGALTVAVLATLLTNAVPIAAGTIVLGEPVPLAGLSSSPDGGPREQLLDGGDPPGRHRVHHLPGGPLGRSSLSARPRRSP